MNLQGASLSKAEDSTQFDQMRKHRCCGRKVDTSWLHY